MGSINNIYIKTFGCRLNISESESLAYRLVKNFNIVEKAENADVIVINTCSVTETAEIKFKRFVSPLLKKNKKIIVTGCYFDSNSIIFHNSNVLYIEKQNLFNEIERILNSKKPIQKKLLDNSLQRYNQFPKPALNKILHSRAFLKIQDGCDNSCTYCSVRLVRGSAISLDYTEVIKRFKDIMHFGYQEIIITGINIASYNNSNKSLSLLLEGMISTIHPDKTVWIQLSSLEAQNIDSFFYIIIQNPYIKPYFHIPLQSGSPSVLKAMNRQYTIESFYTIVEKIKKIRKDSFLSTDVIVGFPGETADDFNSTYSVCKDIGFHHLHIFPYSKRNNTIAATLPYNIKDTEIKNRLSSLKKISDTNKLNYYHSFLNKEESFILTKKSSTHEGKSYHSLDIEFKGKDSEQMHKGYIYRGKIQNICNFKAQIW